MNPGGTLVELFEEAAFLARDETLLDAERGRRLVDLLGMASGEVRRIRLTHQYGKPLADDVLMIEKTLGPYRRVRSRHPGEAAPTIVPVPRLAARTVAKARGGRPTLFDTEAIAAEIERDGIWPVIARHGMSYQHAVRIRSGWRPRACLRSGRIEARGRTIHHNLSIPEPAS